jgi:hypothetical protein
VILLAAVERADGDDQGRRARPFWQPQKADDFFVLERDALFEMS